MRADQLSPIISYKIIDADGIKNFAIGLCGFSFRLCDFAGTTFISSKAAMEQTKSKGRNRFVFAYLLEIELNF